MPWIEKVIGGRPDDALDVNCKDSRFSNVLNVKYLIDIRLSDALDVKM